MLECLVLGDSIGVGISQVRKECAAYVQSGINSEKYLTSFIGISRQTKLAIISLGSNDTKQVRTYESLRKLRQSVDAMRVIWILPSQKVKYEQYLIVKQLASEFNDSTLEPAPIHLSGDKIHPTGLGYRVLSEQTK